MQQGVNEAWWERRGVEGAVDVEVEQVDRVDGGSLGQVGKQ